MIHADLQESCRNSAFLSDTRKSKGFIVFTAELREYCKSADRYLPDERKSSISPRSLGTLDIAHAVNVHAALAADCKETTATGSATSRNS